MRAIFTRAMGFIAGATLVLSFSFAAQAFCGPTPTKDSATGAHGRFTGFVKIAKDREIYADFIKPAPGQPIAVLLNGLTYRLGCWDAFVERLQAGGIGILRYDMQGQGETLLKYAPILAAIPLQDQVNDLDLLLTALKIQTPVNLVTLSYGGAVGLPFTVQHPERVANLILMAPFVAPLDSQDQWIKLQIEQTRLMYPNNPATFDDLYDYFLHVIIYQTYPAAEPIVLENPFKLEATFRLVQGARKYHAKEIVNQLTAGKTHLIVALQDQYVPNDVHEEFWKQVPQSARASRLFINGSEHKIPEMIPAYSAAWVRLIMTGDARIAGGVTFKGEVSKRNASNGSTIIDHLGE